MSQKRGAAREPPSERDDEMSRSWKDEFLVVATTVLVASNFIPWLQDYMIQGWNCLSHAPDWFVWSYVGMIAASFGAHHIIPLVQQHTHHKTGTKDRKGV